MDHQNDNSDPDNENVLVELPFGLPELFAAFTERGGEVERFIIDDSGNTHSIAND